MLPKNRPCDVENLEDFNRYYNASWVSWRKPDSPNPLVCYVGNPHLISKASLRPLVKSDTGFSVSDAVHLKFSELKEQVDFGLPDVGITADGPTIIFTSYTTARAPRKGFRIRDTRTTEFNNYDIKSKFLGGNGNDRYDRIWNTFYPEYSSMKNAFIDLEEGKLVGASLSKDFGLYTLPKFQYPLLAYKRWTIGHVTDPGLVYLRDKFSEYKEHISKVTDAKVVTL